MCSMAKPAMYAYVPRNTDQRQDKYAVQMFRIQTKGKTNMQMFREICRCADIHAPSLPSSPDIWLGACSPQLLLLSLRSSP